MASARSTACFKCGALAQGNCSRCGQPFCDKHGGDRWVWQTNFGKTSGWLIQPARQIACDACSWDPFWIAVILGVVALLLIVLFVML